MLERGKSLKKISNDNAVVKYLLDLATELALRKLNKTESSQGTVVASLQGCFAYCVDSCLL